LGNYFPAQEVLSKIDHWCFGDWRPWPIFQTKTEWEKYFLLSPHFLMLCQQPTMKGIQAIFTVILPSSYPRTDGKI